MAYVDIEVKAEINLAECDLSEAEIEEFIRTHFEDLDIDAMISIVGDATNPDYFVPLLVQDLPISDVSNIVWKILDHLSVDDRNEVLKKYSSSPRGTDILAKYLDTLNPSWQKTDYPFNNATFIASIIDRLVRKTPIPQNTIKPAEQSMSLEYE
jgi:hypothetical protein